MGGAHLAGGPAPPRNSVLPTHVRAFVPRTLEGGCGKPAPGPSAEPSPAARPRLLRPGPRRTQAPQWPAAPELGGAVRERPAPHPSGASRLRGSRAGEPRPPPRGRVVRAGGGPRSGLCLGLPGLVQSPAASLSDRADPGGFGDFAGALQPSPGEEGAGSPRDLLAPSHGERRFLSHQHFTT
uniref:serine/threonine-protein phosphatase 1 regulatory subunit 10-like isoform X2 n=1 Tax=Halichoerus grypus TaxID=9711 RepID=UPI001658CFD1|nr:serine/threonine-protein phosphatase 1 regulatory subunit 10-like isoform X2 [Halichoerus grypus]